MGGSLLEERILRGNEEFNLGYVKFEMLVREAVVDVESPDVRV